jgi:hypothetical protein
MRDRLLAAAQRQDGIPFDSANTARTQQKS